jgi:hypothetical protein
MLLEAFIDELVPCLRDHIQAIIHYFFGVALLLRLHIFPHRITRAVRSSEYRWALEIV